MTALIANIYYRGNISDIQKADAIIVLGAAQWDGKPSPIFQARLDQAQKLYAAAHAPRIIVTGGKTPRNTIADSRAGKDYLAQHRVNPDDVFTEDESRTTLQNLMFAREIMKTRQFRSAILVSHDFHMMRARHMAKDLGIIVFAAPVKTKNQFAKLQYAAREAAVYAAYLLFHI